MILRAYEGYDEPVGGNLGRSTMPSEGETMSYTIQRYGYTMGGTGIVKDPNGVYVFYADHLAVVAKMRGEIDRLTRQLEAARKSLTDEPTFWVVEQFEDGNGRSLGYWTGHNSRDFTPNIIDAIQFCRKDDALIAKSSWHWTDCEVTEHKWIASRTVPVAANPPVQTINMDALRKSGVYVDSVMEQPVSSAQLDWEDHHRGHQPEEQSVGCIVCGDAVHGLFRGFCPQHTPEDLKQPAEAAPEPDVSPISTAEVMAGKRIFAPESFVPYSIDTAQGDMEDHHRGHEHPAEAAQPNHPDCPDCGRSDCPGCVDGECLHRAEKARSRYCKHGILCDYCSADEQPAQDDVVIVVTSEPTTTPSATMLVGGMVNSKNIGLLRRMNDAYWNLVPFVGDIEGAELERMAAALAVAREGYVPASEVYTVEQIKAAILAESFPLPFLYEWVDRVLYRLAHPKEENHG